MSFYRSNLYSSEPINERALTNMSTKVANYHPINILKKSVVFKCKPRMGKSAWLANPKILQVVGSRRERHLIILLGINNVFCAFVTPFYYNREFRFIGRSQHSYIYII